MIFLYTSRKQTVLLTMLAFGEDVNIRLASVISRAKLIGANTEHLVDLNAGAALFTSVKPVVL